jgi:hypothetical protein
MDIRHPTHIAPESWMAPDCDLLDYVFFWPEDIFAIPRNLPRNSWMALS